MVEIIRRTRSGRGGKGRSVCCRMKAVYANQEGLKPRGVLGHHAQFSMTRVQGE